MPKMIIFPLVCRLKTLCTLGSVISRRIHILNRLGPQQWCTTQHIPKWTHSESRVCFYPQQKVDFQCLEIRSFSTDPESKLVHVLDSNDKLVQKMTLKKANIFAHKAGMQLFHVRNEGENDVDEYKLLSEAEFKKAVLKDKDEPTEKLKEFHLGVNIHERDLSIKLKSIKKRLLKGSHVKIVLTSHGFSSKRRLPFEGKLKADADQVMAVCVEEFKDIARVTRVMKASKMYIIQFETNDSIKAPSK